MSGDIGDKINEILNNPEASQQKMKELFNGNATICEDGMIVEM